MRVVRRHVVRLERVDAQPVPPGHGRRHAVVGGRGASRPGHLGSAGEQGLHQHGGLRLDVQAHPDPAARERPVPLHLGAQAAQHGHVGACPRDSPLTVRGERRVCDEAGLQAGEVDRRLAHGHLRCEYARTVAPWTGRSPRAPSTPPTRAPRRGRRECPSPRCCACSRPAGSDPASWTSAAAPGCMPCSLRNGATTWWAWTSPSGPWSSPVGAPPRRAWASSSSSVTPSACPHGCRCWAPPSTASWTSGCSMSSSRTNARPTPRPLLPWSGPAGPARSSRGATGTRSGEARPVSGAATSAPRSGRRRGGVWRRSPPGLLESRLEPGHVHAWVARLRRR